MEVEFGCQRSAASLSAKPGTLCPSSWRLSSVVQGPGPCSGSGFTGRGLITSGARGPRPVTS